MFILQEEEPSSHLVRLLAEWSETFPYDFRDERVMSHVRELAHRCVSIEEGEIREEISLVLHNLLDKLTKLEQYEAFLHSINKDAVTDNVDAVTQVFQVIFFIKFIFDNFCYILHNVLLYDSNFF